jgi:uncharacterized membrane protein YhaH (DUF805 family)
VSTPAKTCVICGEDCSTRPRTKNPEGQYACNACLEERRRERAAGAGAAVAAPAAAEPSSADLDDAGLDDAYEVDDGMGVLLEDLSHADLAPEASPDANQPSFGAIAIQSVCPRCGQSVASDAAMCVSCGTNISTGRGAKTKVHKPKGNTSRGRESFLQNGAVVFALGAVALLGIAGGCGAVSAMNPGAFLAVFAFGVLASVVATISMIIAAFRDGDAKWGLVGIAQILPVIGSVCSFAFGFYYCIFGSERTSWKLGYWGAQMILIGAFTGGLVSLGPAGVFGFLTTDPPQAAVEMTRDGEDVWAVNDALTAIADHVIMTRLDADPHHREAALYEHLLGWGIEIDEYPSDVVSEAKAIFRSLGDSDRQQVISTLMYPP